MLDELLSGFLGSTVAELAMRRWPPRKLPPEDELPWNELHRRNRPIYKLAYMCGCIVFASMLVYVYATSHRDGWLIGALFGLPFASMMIVSFATTFLGGGRRRTAEFLRYWEIRERLNIWVMTSVFAPLVALGFVSVLMSVRRFLP